MSAVAATFYLFLNSLRLRTSVELYCQCYTVQYAYVQCYIVHTKISINYLSLLELRIPLQTEHIHQGPEAALEIPETKRAQRSMAPNRDGGKSRQNMQLSTKSR